MCRRKALTEDKWIKAIRLGSDSVAYIYYSYSRGCNLYYLWSTVSEIVILYIVFWIGWLFDIQNCLLHHNNFFINLIETSYTKVEGLHQETFSENFQCWQNWDLFQYLSRVSLWTSVEIKLYFCLKRLYILSVTTQRSLIYLSAETSPKPHSYLASLFILRVFVRRIPLRVTIYFMSLSNITSDSWHYWIETSHSATLSLQSFQRSFFSSV